MVVSESTKKSKSASMPNFAVLFSDLHKQSHLCFSIARGEPTVNFKKVVGFDLEIINKVYCRRLHKAG